MATETSTRSPLRTMRIGLWVLVAVAAVAFAALAFRAPQREPAPTSNGITGLTLGGPFTLIGTDGKPFSSAALAGKPYAIFFGFTHCPDVCPNTLGRLAALRSKLGKGDDAFGILFVSVDPKRDTPAVMRDYVGLFGTPVIGLTGSEQQVAQVAKSHGIYHKAVSQAEAADGYTVDHGSAVLLFGRDGQFVATIAQEEGEAPALDKLRRITA